MKDVTVKDRVTTLARGFLGPTFKAEGFRRTGRVFWRNTNEVCQVVSLKMRRFGTSKDGSFDVFLGVFWHNVERLLQNASAGKMPPPDYRCTFRIDLGWTTPARLQKSWKVDLETDLEKLSHELLHDLTNFGLPWLQYRSKFEHVMDGTQYMKKFADGLNTSHELINAATRVGFMAILGMDEQAKKELYRFIENGHAEHAHTVAQRLGISL